MSTTVAKSDDYVDISLGNSESVDASNESVNSSTKISRAPLLSSPIDHNANHAAIESFIRLCQ